MKQLPDRSRVVAASQGGSEYRGWTFDRHLLAAILDALNINTHAFVSANSKRKVKSPKPVPRPGDEERKKEAKQNNPFALMVKAQMNRLKEQGSGPKKIVIDDPKEVRNND